MAVKDEKAIAFIEEQENLNAMENTLDNIIKHFEKPLEKAKSELDQYSYVLNREDLENKQYYLGRKYKIDEKIYYYEDFKPSPYFGRFDLKSNGGEDTFFVGYEPLSYDGEALIIGWREPLGKVFYNKTETSYNVYGKKYDLTLRRAINIKDEKLIAVNTEYDALGLSLDGEVVDPFLLSVLRDKRRNHKLTDIIKTIQSNQYNIISRPLEENFIVQGCAGSGKTMILLHRLSFIAFNYPDVSFSKFCILTPNEHFNEFIDELSVELGLDKIKRYTVESFYSTLIESRSYADNVASSKANNLVHKLPATTKGLASEKKLNNDLLKYLYSEELYDLIVKTFTDNNKASVDKLNELNIWSLLKKHGKKVDIITDLNYKSFSAYYSALRDVLSKHEAEHEDYLKQSSAVASQEDRVSKLNNDNDKVYSVLLQLKGDLQSVCNEQINASNKKLPELKTKVQEYNNKLAPITAERDEAREEIKKLQSDEVTNEYEISEVSTYEYLSTHNDEISSMIKELCSEDYSELEKLYSQMDSFAFYNFGRRARVKADITELEKKLEEKAKEIVEVFSEDKSKGEKYLKELLDKEAALCDTIVGIKAERDRIGFTIDKLEKEAEKYTYCKKILEAGETPNLSEYDDVFNDEKTFKISKQYNKFFNERKEIRKQIDIQSRILDSEKSKLDNIRKELLSDEEVTRLKEAFSVVQKHDMKELYIDFEEMLKSIYERFGQKYSSKENHRHKLYLKLLLCALYYGPANNLGYYIYVDEAQDLAKTEYKVLKLILGDKTVFNLYGDVNQLIYDYKGISDWDELPKDISAELYFLNENYRNTIEITDYCNDVFGAQITGIGLSGYDVEEVDLKEGIEKIERIQSENRSYRCAIICNYSIDVKKHISSLLISNHTYGNVEKGIISILTPEESKGLEFDAVLVIKNDMTLNEQYLSFTRALDNLIVAEM